MQGSDTKLDLGQTFDIYTIDTYNTHIDKSQNVEVKGFPETFYVDGE